MFFGKVEIMSSIRIFIEKIQQILIFLNNNFLSIKIWPNVFDLVFLSFFFNFNFDRNFGMRKLLNLIKFVITMRIIEKNTNDMNMFFCL